MDPTTTLMTFMLQTSSHARSVQLIGSWDNFSKRYPMEKDARRGHGEWRGCYSFKDIICDGDTANSAKRNGGLKMGQTYYYYYEIDDGIEIHDPTRPFTTACQYLPGQPVNFLWVPVEETPLRERSASVGATGTDIKTMNPADKYLTPRAPPPTPKSLPRLNTSPGVIARKRGARSTSPVPRSPWSARVLFGLKSPISAAPNNDRRLSPSRSHEGDAHISYPTLFDSSSPSAYDSTDEYVVTDDGFDFGFSTPKPPVILEGAERDAQAGSFYGYSLPLGPADEGMEKHNRSDSLATVTLEEGGARSSFGSPVFQSNSPASPDNRTVTALDELLDELGYLGDFISGD
ncbi:hypothetical protein VE04_03920 [Pseudogymnoascus sp. 24MN13]|nr:hypothetical protein VE04_03920 [Pseudogymnoascus sp. 24MN13]